MKPEVISKSSLQKQTSFIRKKTRLLSSLLDLRLSVTRDKKQVDDQLKRKCIKYCPIKAFVNQSDIYENFQVVEKKKSLVDKNLIIKSLGSHFIFSNLIKQKIMLQLLLDKFKMCRVNKGQYLMKQNDNASSFFVLHDGQLAVEIDGKVKKSLNSGDGFGELALLYSSPRSASIKATKASFLWYIDRKTFRRAISSLIEKNFNQTRKFIEDTLFFSYLTPTQKDKIASIAIIQKFNKDQIICKQGELASSMYILKSGELSKTSILNNIKIKRGCYFGQYAVLQKNCKWKETICAKQDSQIIALGAEDVQYALGKSVPVIITRNIARQCLLNAKQFTKLTAHYQNLALDCFKIRNVSIDEKLFSSPFFIFIVIEGQYQILTKQGKISVANQNDKMLFGSVVQDSKRSQIKLKTNGKIAWTTAQQLLSNFKGSYEETVKKSLAIQNSQIKHQDYITEVRTQYFKYTVNDFKVLTKLGQGQFGTVFLVTDPSKTRFYALKCISKFQTIKCKLQKHILNEKTVMEQMNLYTPFCVNFIRSFKDANFVYFLMQYINGIALFDAIRVIGLLNSQQTRFYGALILEFLQKIHSKNIIYRDLKPENVMVTQDGYLKIIDMGTCKKLYSNLKNGENNNFFTLKTFTIIGTPNYMAPEIIQGKGYSSAVDLWSLGIVIYEFMAGQVPFGQQAEDPYAIYKQILKKTLKFPSFIKDQTAISFIKQLLSKLPQVRLGSSYSELKKHDFLSPIQWSALLEKKIKPAFMIPKNKLIQIQKLLPKAKNLSTQLPKVSSKILGQKDLNSNWDQCF